MSEQTPNPYAFENPSEDAVAPRVKLPLVVNGPLTFEDFRDSDLLDRRRPMLFFIPAVVLFAISLMGKLDVVFITLALTLAVVSLPLVGLYSDWRLRKSFKKSIGIKSWTVKETEVVQHFENGNTLTIPFDSLLKLQSSDRVARIRLELSAHIVPRSGFAHDSEWLWFLDRAKRGSEAEIQERYTAETLKTEPVLDGTIHIDGPMSSQETSTFATRLFQAIPRWARLFMLVPWILNVGSFLATLSPLLTGRSPALSGLLLNALLLGFLLFLRHVVRVCLREGGQNLLGWRVDTDGVRVWRQTFKESCAWQAIKEYEFTPQGILFKTQAPMIVPRSGFRSEDDWNRACEMFSTLAKHE